MNDWNHCIIENQKRYKLFNVEIITGILNARGSKYPTKNIVRSSAFVLSKSLKYFKNVDVHEYQGLTIMWMRWIFQYLYALLQLSKVGKFTINYCPFEIRHKSYLNEVEINQKKFFGLSPLNQTLLSNSPSAATNNRQRFDSRGSKPNRTTKPLNRTTKKISNR